MTSAWGLVFEENALSREAVNDPKGATVVKKIPTYYTEPHDFPGCRRFSENNFPARNSL